MEARQCITCCFRKVMATDEKAGGPGNGNMDGSSEAAEGTVSPIPASTCDADASGAADSVVEAGVAAASAAATAVAAAAATTVAAVGASADGEDVASPSAAGSVAQSVEALADPDERVHSVYISVPSGLEWVPLDVVFDDQMQVRIAEMCQSIDADGFNKRWPEGQTMFVDAMFQGLESGKFEAARGLDRADADALFAQLSEMFAAEIRVDRNAFAGGAAPLRGDAAGADVSRAGQIVASEDPSHVFGREEQAGAETSSEGSSEGHEDDNEAVPVGEAPPEAEEAAATASEASPTTEADEKIHSVYVAIPEGFEGLPIDMIFDENVQARIYDITRRSVSPDVFRRLWRGGRRAMLESMLRGLEETGRGAVAHGLQRSQATSLAAQLTDLVTAEVAVDREAAAKAAEAGPSEANSGGRGSGSTEAGSSDANARIHSLYCVLPADLQGMLDFVLPEIMPRITGHRREFSLSWPGGPAEMERSLRQGIEEFGRGPLLHGLRLAQAEALTQQIQGLIEVEAVVDREAAKRVQERERRSRPPPRPPPASLLSRFVPGARVRIVPGGEERKAEAQKLQQGYASWSDDHQSCLGKTGTVVAYSPVEASGQWSVRVSCELESGAVCQDWNPANLRAHEVELPCSGKQEASGQGDCGADDHARGVSNLNLAGTWTMVDEEKGQAFHYEWFHAAGSDSFKGTQQGAGEVTDGRIKGDAIEWKVGEIACAGKLADGGHKIFEGRYWTVGGEQVGTFIGKKDQELLLVKDEDLLVEDNVLFHNENRWCVGVIDGAGEEEDSFAVRAIVRGNVEANVPRQHIQLVVVLEPSEEPVVVGSVVRIVSEQEEAKRTQRGRWTDELVPCLGQLGVVMEVKDRRRMVVRCPAVANPTVWNASCLKLDKSEGLRCLDVHSRPLWWCYNMQQTKKCAGECGKTDLKEAYCCLQAAGSDGCALCSACAAPYKPGPAPRSARSRHHLCELSWVALPRGPQRSCWPCAGMLFPGGCRSTNATTSTATGGWCCAEYEFLLCEACHGDAALGEATPETRRLDVSELPNSVARIRRAFHVHPSEVFALVEAGLLTALAGCLASDAPARSLALDIGAWLAAGPPERPGAGPTLVDVGDGKFGEAYVVAEEPLSFDGSWTDESAPGRRVCTIKDGMLYPPKSPEAKIEHGFEVVSCGLAEFNGWYAAEGTRNGKTKFRKVTGGPQTCNFSDGYWYFAHDFCGSWYQATADTNMPPTSGWTVGDNGEAPPPTLIHLPAPAHGERFAFLPSVGTWLQRRIETDSCSSDDDDDESETPPLLPADLDGIWRREGSNVCDGDCMVICGTKLAWPDGTSTEIRLTGDGGASMEFQGQAYEGQAKADASGLRLEWSDGDVWIHCPQFLSAFEDLPEEGQPVSYQGFSGCYIKEVISNENVIVHVPGVGDRQAATGQYTLRDSGVAINIHQPCKVTRLSRDSFAVDLEDGIHCAQLAEGGRLIWVDGAHSWVRIENCKRCPGGHILRRSASLEPWRCKMCSEKWTHRRRLRCRACDINYCENCLTLQKWERSSSSSDTTVGMVSQSTTEESGAEVCLPSCAVWSSCQVVGAGEEGGSFNIRVLSAKDGESSDDKHKSVAAWRLRAQSMVPTLGSVDALWLYESSTDRAMGIRYRPEIEGPHRGEIGHGEVIRVTEHRPGADGVMFLRLADGRGWVFDTKPGVGTMCMLLRCRSVDDGLKDSASGPACSVLMPSSGSSLGSMPLGRLRPSFGADGPPTVEDTFSRAELTRLLRRGPHCPRQDVQALLQRRVSLLQVDDGGDLLAIALQSSCSAAVIEVLLLSHVPVVAGVADNNSDPAAAPATTSQNGNEQAETAETTQPQQPLDVVGTVLALGEPRLATLLAERGGAIAEKVAAFADSHLPTAAKSQNSTSDVSVAEEEVIESLVSAYSTCATAARRLAAPRVQGSIVDLLRQFGRDLLIPLVRSESGQFEAFSPSSWLGLLTKALAKAGYDLTHAQTNCFAQAIICCLVEGSDDAVHDALAFMKLLFDMLTNHGGNIGAIMLLKSAFQRHGISARLEFLARGDGLMDWEADRSVAAGLLEQLRDFEPSAADTLLMRGIAAALPCASALEELIRMLKEGECTPYELWTHDIPAKMLPLFQASDEVWPWANAIDPPADAASMSVLVSSLQVLLGMWETFPVATLNTKGDGLDCLLHPHKVHLRGTYWKKDLSVELLLPVADLERFVLQTVPIEDKTYLEWCSNLCGQRIADSTWSPTSSWRTALVTGCSTEVKQPVHTVVYEDSGEEMQLLLHLRRVVVLGKGQWSASAQKSSRARAAWKTLSSKLLVFSAGSTVDARFKDGAWCRAHIDRDNGDGTFTIRWVNGTKTDTSKRICDMQPLPGKHMCQKVKVITDAGELSGVAVWLHASGAQDVVDHDGRYFSAVPADRIVLDVQNNESGSRSAPFEIRNLSLQGPQGPLQLERSFSAVDRHRPQLGAVPTRRIGGPEGEPLRRDVREDSSASRAVLEQEMGRGQPAPRLKVRFFPAPDLKPPKSEPPSPDKTMAGDSAATSSSYVPEEKDLLPQLPSSSTVLQALLEQGSGKQVKLSEKACLYCKVEVQDDEATRSQIRTGKRKPFRRCTTDIGDVGVTGIAVPVLALLRRLKSLLAVESAEGTKFNWESEPLNRKLEDQLAQPLLALGVATPAWVQALPLAYPFLFTRRLREQLLHCTGFGTSHAVLWLQRRSIEEQYGERLRRVEGQGETQMNLRDNIVNDRRVFIGPARSEVVTLSSRSDLLNDAHHIMELTHTSRAVLEVKFADEGGFGDGATQSFYTAVAVELSATETGAPRCGSLQLWAEHGEESVVEHQGRTILHARRGLFPRPYPPNNDESRRACQHFRFLGRLMAKSLRDGFVVPLPLCRHFFAAVLGEDLPVEALPNPHDGYAGEFVGAAAKFAAHVRYKHSALSGEERFKAYREEGDRPQFGENFLLQTDGVVKDWSFNQYVESCGITFCEFGAGGRELMDGGSRRALDIDNLEEFVERASRWWLREGIAPQVAAFQQGVEDVCSSSAIWAFEPAELVAMFCGDQVEWTRGELERHIRTKGDVDKRDLKMLLDALEKMSPERRGFFLEFVTACPRLPPGGIAALQPEITIVSSNPAGSLPRARTCVNELHLPKYENLEQLEARLAWALENAEGLYDDNRMGWMA